MNKYDISGIQQILKSKHTVHNSGPNDESVSCRVLFIIESLFFHKVIV